MKHLFAFLLMQVWIAVILGAWMKNRHGRFDAEPFDRFARSLWTRWMLGGSDRKAHMRQQRLLHRFSLPFALGVYLFVMYMLLISPAP